MPSKSRATQIKNKKRPAARKHSSFKNFFQRKKILIFMVLFALLGSYMLYRSFALTAVAPYRGIWLSQEQIAALPTTGTAWTSLKNVADSDIGTPQISDQNNKHSVKTLGVALVYAKTGNDTYRVKARDAIMAAIGTECLPSADGVRTLALGRNLAGYVFAADLINLPQMGYTSKSNPCKGVTENFEQWLTHIRTDIMPDHGRWKTLTQTHENSASNWGGFAGASRIAASLYLGDTADVATAAKFHKAYVDRSVYPARSWGVYFQPTASYDGANWACGDSNTWLALNPSCTKSGYNLDGALVEDISRETADMTMLPQPSDSPGVSYSWEVLQGLVVQAEMLRRFGYENLWTMPGEPLKRALDFMQRAGWHENYSVSHHVPWMANYYYGNRYPVVPAAFGRVMGWTDWSHDASSRDTTAPSQPGNLTAAAQSTTQINLSWSSSTDNVGVTGYDVYRKSPTATTYAKVATVGTNSYSDTGLSANTTYSYYVLAKDAAGNASTASATVAATTLAAPPPETDTTAPTVSITDPTNGSTLRNVVTVSASASDNTRVNKMEVYIDNSLKSTSTSGSISYKWNARKASKGAHTISVKAYDQAGNVSQKSIVVYR